ncbi:phenylalanine 4-monooxygenase [Vibrio sp. LaRot3]|uniref:phenylalanine 4-monooxygenase n=1 Tax=Vibrio sp. LaRot3 TaxID=2998829 RepID=UPI0022CDEB06|nr:phenylalanine 4-monooxygenase [Vibrio sp. LaRot3]MDA0148149.1 phenylalanine 4-monooxygenase [Vibrio sp. LaRot3]
MTQYQSKPVDTEGRIAWDENEDSIWCDLVQRQQQLVQSRACRAYLDGLKLLDLPTQRAPHLYEINQVLLASTGWRVEPVPALISFDRFFALLAAKRFPVATFLRSRDEFDYLQEPDFFHEIYGHCAMLTNPDFAHFTHVYGQLGQAAEPAQRAYLARLYWFTVEFGLVEERGKLKIYGGGILSSPGETRYALESDKAQRVEFSINRVLRTPYRIDIMQPIYFVLGEISQLYQLSQVDLMQEVAKAQQQGLFPPLFEQKAVI